jgi:hypothetical protein
LTGTFFSLGVNAKKWLSTCPRLEVLEFYNNPILKRTDLIIPMDLKTLRLGNTNRISMADIKWIALNNPKTEIYY